MSIFKSGVASGDPLTNRVIIWTRIYLNDDLKNLLTDPISVKWEISETSDFKNCNSGITFTNLDSDYTVKIDVLNLKADTIYWYRFKVNNEYSRIGRTKTLPISTENICFAQVTCNNYLAGYFGAYRVLSERNDLAFILHLGDYIYEYGNSDSFRPPELIGIRDHDPIHKCITLCDYRTRYAQYRADADLQNAHAMHPFISIFDDHEVSNDTWKNGAKHHFSEDGNFQDRKNNAYRAFLEWTPIRIYEAHDLKFYRSFKIGNLASIHIIETRGNRSEQVSKEFIPLGINSSLEKKLNDPKRQILESTQFQWLQEQLQNSNTQWNIIGNGVVLAPMNYPGTFLNKPERIYINPDQWDGYRVDRNKLYNLLSNFKNIVVLTGDLHASLVAQLCDSTGKMIGVEFVAPSISSDGYYEFTKENLNLSAEATIKFLHNDQMIEYNPYICYFEPIRHGFVIIEIKRDTLQADYYLTPIPSTKNPNPKLHKDTIPVFEISFITDGSGEINIGSQLQK
jgi:alkaline phosphatase D